MAALHFDSMSLAAKRAHIEPTELKTAKGAQGAAQTWLRELTIACVEELAESLPELVLARLSEILDWSINIEMLGLTVAERRLREEFGQAAKSLVQGHFRVQRRILLT